jgi:DNA-binding protein HU-beta
MNKTQLIESIAGQEGLTKASAGRVLEKLLETIQVAVSKGDEVVVIGFGRFVAKNTLARKGRNPKTGEEMGIPAKRVPRFIPGSAFRAAVAVKSEKT